MGKVALRITSWKVTRYIHYLDKMLVLHHDETSYNLFLYLSECCVFNSQSVHLKLVLWSWFNSMYYCLNTNMWGWSTDQIRQKKKKTYHRLSVKSQFSLRPMNASYFRSRAVFKFLRRLAWETPWFTHFQEISDANTGQKEHCKCVSRFQGNYTHGPHSM